MTTVLACGLAVLDVQQTVDRLPGADEKIVAEDLLVAAGGPAANAAVTARALGVRARLVTRIGRSPLGELIHADLAAYAVEVLDCGSPDERPAVSTVLVTRGTGQRAVVSVNAAHRHDQTPDRRAAKGRRSARDWASTVVAGANALLVDGHHLDLAVPVAAAARELGVPVLLDGGSWKPGLERLLTHVDIALISEVFAVPSDLVDAAEGTLSAVAALGPSVVARSRGSRPIEVRTGTRQSTVSVPSVEVVDTLGAGDVLHGALATWLAARGADALADGLEWAARVAADSCTAAGARGWLDAEDLVASRRGELGRHR